MKPKKMLRPFGGLADGAPAIEARVPAPVLRAHARLVREELVRLERSSTVPPELKQVLAPLSTLLDMMVAELSTWR